MGVRAAGRVAWSVSGFSVVCAVLGSVFLFLNGVAVGTQEFDYSGGGAILALSFSTVGGLVVSRRPENLVGWTFLVIGLSQGFDAFDTQYGRYALITSKDVLPGEPLMVWFASWTWAPGAALAATLSLLLFPDGRLPSSRWRPVPWGVALAITLIVLPSAIVLWPLRGSALVSGPAPAQIAGGWVMLLQGFALLLVVVCMIASAASLVVRFRRSRGVERQQLKWLTYAGLATVLVLSSTFFLPNSIRAGALWQVVDVALLLTVVPSIPIAVGIAILRYRLYDIDLIINKTLVYTPLTAALVFIYLVGVIGLQRLFEILTGQGSDLAIIASTLTIAALFNPLRRRIRDLIDRRFYRSKYDARKTLEAFSARLREETDLEALGSELVGVVRQTMQPVHVSLWLRPPGKGGSARRARSGLDGST